MDEPRPFMPDDEFVLTRGQARDRKSTMTIRDSGIRMIGHKPVGTHPVVVRALDLKRKSFRHWEARDGQAAGRNWVGAVELEWDGSALRSVQGWERADGMCSRIQRRHLN